MDLRHLLLEVIGVLMLTHMSGPKGVVNRCTCNKVEYPGKYIYLINNDWVINISR
jgi:hypothetical protein